MTSSVLSGCAVRSVTKAIPVASEEKLSQDFQRTVWDGVYTVEQATRGKLLYRERCTYCHGVFLDGGDSPNGPPLRGIRFVTQWKTQTVARLFGKISQTMPLDNPGSLSLESSGDLVSYILQENGMPSGDIPLASTPELLQAIAILDKVSEQ